MPNVNNRNIANMQAALDLAKVGIHTFPVGLGKRPKIKGWQAKATTDARQIERWFAKWPDAMPAIVTGQRNGVAVLDLDVKDGKDGMAEKRKLGFDPDAMSPIIVRSPSGGRHVYFRLPGGLGNSAQGLPPGVDVRGEGGLVVRNYGRAFWKRWTGYQARSRIEAKMRCLKAFGERIAARDPHRQTAEIHIRIALHEPLQRPRHRRDYPHGKTSAV